MKGLRTTTLHQECPAGRTGRVIRRLVLATGLLGLGLVVTGCAGTPLKPQPPEVTVAGVRPLNLSLTEQSLLFTLRVKNPNAFSLPIEGLDFTAQFSDQNIASGTSTGGSTIPARGEGTVDVEVTTRLQDIAGKLGALLKGGGLKLNYTLDGNVRVKDRKEAYPFSLKGDLMSMLQKKN